MPLTFWIKRFLVVFSGVFIVLLAVAVLKDRTFERAVTESAMWAAISSVIFTATRIYHSRKGHHCELCGDTPGKQKDDASKVKKEGRE